MNQDIDLDSWADSLRA
jgi:hypothetical protein